MTTSPRCGVLKDGKRVHGISKPISVYGMPIQSGVRIPYANLLPMRKSPVRMVVSMDPVGTIYASTSVALNERAIKIIIARERISLMIFDNVFI
tara:strand:- start:1436 stop:1717 length:282 start_codon:yes stop_codon:yes gene_type:complete